MIFMEEVYIIMIEKVEIRPNDHDIAKWILFFIEVGLLLKELMQTPNLV